MEGNLLTSKSVIISEREELRDFTVFLCDKLGEDYNDLHEQYHEGQKEYKTTCDTCFSELINYGEIGRRTCSCGRMGYNVPKRHKTGSTEITKTT